MTSISSSIQQTWHRQDNSPLSFNLLDYLTKDNEDVVDAPESVLQLKALIQGVKSMSTQSLITDWIAYVLSDKSLTTLELSDMVYQLYAPYLTSKWNDFKTESIQLLTEGLSTEFLLLREAIADNSNLAVLILNELIKNGVLVLWCAHQHRDALPSSIEHPLHQGTYSMIWTAQATAYDHTLQFPETGTIKIDYGYDEFTNEAVYLEDCMKPWYLLRITKNSEEQHKITTTVNSYRALLQKASHLVAHKYVRYVSKFTIAGAAQIELKLWHAKTDMVIITNSSEILKTWKQSKNNLDAVLQILDNSPNPEYALSCSIHDQHLRTLMFWAKRPEFAKFDINFI